MPLIILVVASRSSIRALCLQISQWNSRVLHSDHLDALALALLGRWGTYGVELFRLLVNFGLFAHGSHLDS